MTTNLSLSSVEINCRCNWSPATMSMSWCMHFILLHLFFYDGWRLMWGDNVSVEEGRPAEWRRASARIPECIASSLLPAPIPGRGLHSVILSFIVREMAAVPGSFLAHVTPLHPAPLQPGHCPTLCLTEEQREAGRGWSGWSPCHWPHREIQVCPLV